MFNLIKRILKKSDLSIKVEKLENGIIVKDPSGSNYIQLVQNENGFNIDIGGNVNFSVNGNVMVSTQGTTNYVSFGDINVDSWESTLNMNSRKAIQIKNYPDAIAYRDIVEGKLREYEEWKEKHKDELITSMDEMNNTCIEHNPKGEN